jgi:lipopolysaccharide export system protein LptA
MDILNLAGRIGFLVSIPLLLFSGSLCSSALAADIVQKKTITSGDLPVTIRSNSLEIDNKKGIVIFTGSVEAQKDDMLIRCQKMVIYYQDKGQGKAENKGFRIDRIVAKGDVRIDRPDGGSATAEEAVYYEEEEKLVLHGKPMVKQGEDFVEGSVITLFLKEDRSIVEGGSDRKARAVLSPKNRKR